MPLALWNEAPFIPYSCLAVPAEHVPEFESRQAGARSNTVRQRLIQEPLGQRVVLGLPPFPNVEQLLQRFSRWTIVTWPL